MYCLKMYKTIQVPTRRRRGHKNIGRARRATMAARVRPIDGGPRRYKTCTAVAALNRVVRRVNENEKKKKKRTPESREMCKRRFRII